MRVGARLCLIGTAAGALAACGGPVVPARAPVNPALQRDFAMERRPDGTARVIRVVGGPLDYSDGLTARRAADALCGGAGGVSTSTRDYFDDGAWVFVGGCA